VRDSHAYVHDPPAGEPEATPAGAGDSAIGVRGTRDGLVLSVPEDARRAGVREVAAALAAHLDGADSFFAGAEVIVDLGAREISADEVSFYRLVLEEREVIVRGFTASSPEGRALLRKEGYHPLQVVEPKQPAAGPGGRGAEEVETLYLRRTLRSGTRIRHHGNLVVVGDINPGAEATASGDIIVWGVARGMLHAGALGDEGAIVCALELIPTQLRIGSYYALTPADKGAKAKGREDKDKRPGVPERARLEGGRIVVAPWKAK
jgi:septum site-determining protein MinC